MTKYDAKCYYRNKMVGRCTIADAESFETLMNTYGSAQMVLTMCAYFSEELQGILEKCAMMDIDSPGCGAVRIEVRF